MATMHGYGPYTNGCRCGVCKAAKADYQRARRQVAGAARHNAGGDYVATGITHGTYAGYTDSGCRCAECVTAKSEADRAMPNTKRRAARSRALTRLSREFAARFRQLYDEEAAKS